MSIIKEPAALVINVHEEQLQKEDESKKSAWTV